jgi:hypothetical protein
MQAPSLTNWLAGSDARLPWQRLGITHLPPRWRTRGRDFEPTDPIWPRAGIAYVSSSATSEQITWNGCSGQCNQS